MQSGCVICYDSFDARCQKNDDEVRIVTTLCGHVFHNICINEWIKRSPTCPECRRSVRKRSLTQLFINFCIDNKSDINAEESLDSLKEQLCGKCLECVEKDKKIIGLQIDCAVSERKIEEKDKKIEELQTCFAHSELESLEKDEKIEKLQTCFARSELESLEKDEKIKELQTYCARSEQESLKKDEKIMDLQIDCAQSEKEIVERDKKIEELQTCFAHSELESLEKDGKIKELQTCFARSELESLEKDEKIKELQAYCARSEQESLKKDEKIEELQTCYARSERDVEKMLQQQMKLNNEISAMKQEAKKLSRVEDKNRKLLQEKNTLPSELEHLNTVDTIMEGCPIDVKKILTDVQVHISSEEGKTTYCSLLKKELARSREERTHLQNELTKVKKEVAHSEEKTLLPIEFKLVKHRMRTTQSNSRKRKRQLREKLKKFKDFNSSSSMSLSFGPSNVPVMPSLPNNFSSLCSNFSKCTLVCSLSRDSSSDCKNQATPITVDFSGNKRQKINIFNFVKKYSMVSTQSPETPVLKQFVLGKEEEPSTIQKANYAI